LCDAVLDPYERPNFTGLNVERGKEAKDIGEGRTPAGQSKEGAAIVFGENGVAALMSHGAMVARGESLASQIGIAADDTVLLPDNWGGLDDGDGCSCAPGWRRPRSGFGWGYDRRDLSAGRDQQVTILCLSPQLFCRIASESLALPEGSRVVVAGGNRISRATIRKFKNPNARLLISYGNAETGDTAALIEACADDSALKIGKPSPGVRMYVLDRNLQPVPSGVPGTIYIACGITASTQVSGSRTEGSRSLFLNVAGGRAFSTGDTARYLKTGEIELLNESGSIGRTLDTTVVEELLLEHRAVTEAKVVREGNKFVCYLVLKEDEKVDEEELRYQIEAKMAGKGPSIVMVVLLFLLPHPTASSTRAALSAPARVGRA
jgi:acyl-CoA synthetase (AMP-forming)/AMP-acid ligase II